MEFYNDTYFFFFESEIPFSGKLVPNYQNLYKFLFKLFNINMTSFCFFENYLKSNSHLRKNSESLISLPFFKFVLEMLENALYFILKASFILEIFKVIFLAIFYYLTKFHYLVGRTSWHIGQCFYCDCLLTRLWRHKI